MSHIPQELTGQRSYRRIVRIPWWNEGFFFMQGFARGDFIRKGDGNFRGQNRPLCALMKRRNNICALLKNYLINYK